MPRTVRKLPSYRFHKASGQAVVTLDGRDFYLGPHGTKASRTEYDRLVGEWQANGRRLPRTTGTSVDLTINELIVAYWRHAGAYYRKPDGTPTSEANCIRLALRPLRQRYGYTLARDFTPLCLFAVQQAMIEAGWLRGSINKHTSRIKSAFRWAASRELIDVSVFHGLRTITGVRGCRSDARESESGQAGAS